MASNYKIDFCNATSKHNCPAQHALDVIPEKEMMTLGSDQKLL